MIIWRFITIVLSFWKLTAKGAYRIAARERFGYHRNMLVDKNIGFIAALISEPSRAAMLMALMDGGALPAGELAHRARITPQTASLHLSKLVAGELLALERRGRHRYYRLAGSEVGQTLETLLALAPQTPLLRRQLAEPDDPIRVARTCYDHLAGRLGVSLTQALVKQRVIAPDDEQYRVTKKGAAWFAEFGIDLDQARRSRRVFAKQCLDWTERQPHLAGALGAAILNRLFEQKWIARIKGDRSVRIAPRGKEMFLQTFEIRL